MVWFDSFQVRLIDDPLQQSEVSALEYIPSHRYYTLISKSQSEPKICLFAGDLHVNSHTQKKFLNIRSPEHCENYEKNILWLYL